MKCLGQISFCTVGKIQMLQMQTFMFPAKNNKQKQQNPFFQNPNKTTFFANPDEVLCNYILNFYCVVSVVIGLVGHCCKLQPSDIIQEFCHDINTQTVTKPLRVKPLVNVA